MCDKPRRIRHSLIIWWRFHLARLLWCFILSPSCGERSGVCLTPKWAVIGLQTIQGVYVNIKCCAMESRQKEGTTNTQTLDKYPFHSTTNICLSGNLTCDPCASTGAQATTPNGSSNTILKIKYFSLSLGWLSASLDTEGILLTIFFFSLNFPLFNLFLF